MQRGTQTNGGRNRRELQPNMVGDAETHRELTAAKLSESRLNDLSESSHLRLKGHSAEVVPPRGKDATTVADGTTFSPHYSQIPYMRICLLTKICVQPPKSVPRDSVAIPGLVQSGRNGSLPTRMLPAEGGEGDAMSFYFSSCCRQVSSAGVPLGLTSHFCAFGDFAA